MHFPFIQQATGPGIVCIFLYDTPLCCVDKCTRYYSPIVIVLQESLRFLLRLNMD